MQRSVGVFFSHVREIGSSSYADKRYTTQQRSSEQDAILFVVDIAGRDSVVRAFQFHTRESSISKPYASILSVCSPCVKMEPD